MTEKEWQEYRIHAIWKQLIELAMAGNFKAKMAVFDRLLASIYKQKGQ